MQTRRDAAASRPAAAADDSDDNTQSTTPAVTTLTLDPAAAEPADKLASSHNVQVSHQFQGQDRSQTLLGEGAIAPSKGTGHLDAEDTKGVERWGMGTPS